MNLKQIRQRHGITQAEMAERFGVSRPTYTQIERGEKEPTISQWHKIVELDKKQEEPIKDTRSAFLFDAGKFKEILLYVLEKVGAKSNIGETALHKLLYFIDFDFFEKYGRSLTGATYMKNYHGPTPKQFKPVAEEMISAVELERVKSTYFQYEQKKYLPHRKANLDALTAMEKEHIDVILVRLSDKNATELRAYSHEDVPWLATEDQADIDYQLVFQRTQPYTQVNHEESWVSASASDILKGLGTMSQEEYGYYLNFPKKK